MRLSERWQVWLCTTGARRGSWSRASGLEGEGLQLFERKIVVGLLEAVAGTDDFGCLAGKRRVG